MRLLISIHIIIHYAIGVSIITREYLVLNNKNKKLLNQYNTKVFTLKIKMVIYISLEYAINIKILLLINF